MLFLHFRGYKNTQITLLELMTMEDQLKLIHCTDVLIGVQGAGLQWYVRGLRWKEKKFAVPISLYNVNLSVKCLM